MCSIRGCDSLAPNEDIVRFRCRGWKVIYPNHIFAKTFHFCIVFLFGFGEARTIMISLNPLYFDY